MRIMRNRNMFQQLTFRASNSPNIPDTLDKYFKIAPYQVSSKNEADMVAYMISQKFIGEYGATVGDYGYDAIGGAWWPTVWNNKNTNMSLAYGAAIDVDMESGGSTSLEYFRIMCAVNSTTGNGYFLSVQRGLYTVCPLWYFNLSGIALNTDVKPGFGLPGTGTGWNSGTGFFGTHEMEASSPFIMDTSGTFVIPTYVDMQLNSKDE